MPQKLEVNAFLFLMQQRAAGMRSMAGLFT